MSPFLLLLLLTLVTAAAPADLPQDVIAPDGAEEVLIVLSQDGQPVDLEKQRAEGNIRSQGNNTQIQTKLTELETEVGDEQVYAGGKVEQEYDINQDKQHEQVNYQSVDGEQKIAVAGTQNETDIDIEFTRPDKENVYVDFDVDHSGETYVIEIDDTAGVERERYRVDKQYLDVYVEEQTGGNYIAEEDDQVEIDIDVDIDGIDLDHQDVVRFEIDLFGEKDAADTTNSSNLYVDAEYRNEVKERQIDEQEDPRVQEDVPGALTLLDCSKQLEFAVPSHVVAARGEQFEQACSLDHTSIIPQVLSARWVRVAADQSETEVSNTETLTILYPTCSETAQYRCEMTYLCEGEVRTERSNDMTLLVNNGIIVNSICQVYGDPHIITFDNTQYSFQGECTYLLAMDAAYGRWIIYGRFTRCGQGTCLTSVMVYNQGFMIELQRGWMINLNGEKVTVKEGVPYSPDRSLNVYFDGYEITMELRRPQIQLVWDGLTNLKIEITSQERTVGLCGNNNGDGSDDFMTYYGDILSDSNEFGHRAAVDRYGTCTQPVSILQQDTAAGKQHCQDVLLSPTFSFASNYLEQQAGAGKSMVRSDRFLDACVFDYAADTRFGELSPQCYAGYNYVSVLKRFGLCVPEGWQGQVECLGKEGLQDMVVTQGCPYGDSPLPFDRA